ncbi:GCN5-related N-acetyltransferase [Legionella nautarum]|uniref:GCN5-related N-acetyltransferase n=1 Tax=Legionella nautarum TaxID=45070 RepID=A0A0W0WX27_9GAMM|nr:GNAT family N-acetyltransferase [Legionella nautarum]KTD36804.1 GCN5-related N-acetyltransferase [Legionella nautarum]
MNKDFTLRLASVSDFDALFEIYMDEKINLFLNFEIMDKKTFREIFDDLMSSGKMYVYEYKENIVATCIVMRQKRRANHVVSLGTLATHPKFQGQGIGTQFMKALIEKIKLDGIKRIDLCAEADNPIALNFYKKLGFQLEGILKKYFKRPKEQQYIDEHMLALILE